MVSVAMVSVVCLALYPERVHGSFLLQLQECQEAVSRECEEEVERWRVSGGGGGGGGGVREGEGRTWRVKGGWGRRWRGGG